MWGVGEHTDHGLITLLARDHHGGLQVRSNDEWIYMAADPYVFVVNLGEMLERMTRGGLSLQPAPGAQPQRRRPAFVPAVPRPSWDATVTPLPDAAFEGDSSEDRSDGQSVHAWDGVYGDYVTANVAKVFPSSPLACSDRQTSG